MPEKKTEQVLSEKPEGSPEAIGAPHAEHEGRKLLVVSLTALGIVYGDIGTSPIYALRLCFHGDHPVPPIPLNVLGVVSLIVWSLIVVISVKYLSYVMRADNRGEGGILALLALLEPWQGAQRRGRRALIALGMFGAALLYGDGTITPAISVLSAVEGLEVAIPSFASYVIPTTVAILLLLFIFQRHGTARVGSVFGPVMLAWFVVLAILGVAGIIRRPGVLASLDPRNALLFFRANGWTGFLVLGSVFLAITGGEALYADMGHFGSRPIRLAWFLLALPSLLLNYLGQGALLLEDPARYVQPFYHMAPPWALYPLVGLATAATVIASQAIISGVFSLTRQAVLLGQFPRLRLLQTSSEEIGQIYIPSVNWILAFATIGLVLGFRSSRGLGGAYGVAISTTMLITTTLAFVVARARWGWSLPVAGVVTAAFLVVDAAFFVTNMLKIPYGGWYPLAAGGLCYVVMVTWSDGRKLVAKRLRSATKPMDFLMERISAKPPARVQGTAVFMVESPEGTPPMLLYHLKHNQVLHEQVVLLNVATEDRPRVPLSEQVKVEKLERGFFRVAVRYGFMQNPNVPVALDRCKDYGLEIDRNKVTYYVGSQTLIPATDRPGLAVWRERLYAFMARNTAQPTSFYRIPVRQVIELGIQVEL